MLTNWCSAKLDWFCLKSFGRARKIFMFLKYTFKNITCQLNILNELQTDLRQLQWRIMPCSTTSPTSRAGSRHYEALGKNHIQSYIKYDSYPFYLTLNVVPVYLYSTKMWKSTIFIFFERSMLIKPGFSLFEQIKETNNNIVKYC